MCISSIRWRGSAPCKAVREAGATAHDWRAVRRQATEDGQAERRRTRLGLIPSAILDAGAEDATFVYWLADLYPTAKVAAVDIDADAMAACLAARPTSYAKRVRFECCAFSDLGDEALDLVTAFDVLEHIPDDRAAVAELARALRPGGTLLVHVPRDQWTTRSGVVRRVPDDEAWRINPGHVRQGYDPNGLRALGSAGLSVVQIQLWVGCWGTLAHDVYSRLEHPAPLRLLSISVTEICGRLDRRGTRIEGNTVFAQATKPVA